MNNLEAIRLQRKNAENAFNTIVDESVTLLQTTCHVKVLAAVVFGSTVRGSLKRETDVDVIYVFDELPAGRLVRYRLFSPFQDAQAERLGSLEKEGYRVSFSPIYKSRVEFERWSVLYLDMVDHHRIVHDPLGLVSTLLLRVKNWIDQVGAYKVKKGTTEHWVYGPPSTEPIELTLPP